MNAPPENAEPPAGSAQGFCDEVSGVESDRDGAPVKSPAGSGFADGGRVPVEKFDYAALDSAASEWLELYAEHGLTPTLAEALAGREGPPRGSRAGASGPDGRDMFRALLFTVFPPECVTESALAEAWLNFLALCWLLDPDLFGGISLRALGDLAQRNPMDLFRRVQRFAAELRLPVPGAFTDGHKAALAISRKIRAADADAAKKSPSEIAA